MHTDRQMKLWQLRTYRPTHTGTTTRPQKRRASLLLQPGKQESPVLLHRRGEPATTWPLLESATPGGSVRLREVLHGLTSTWNLKTHLREKKLGVARGGGGVAGKVGEGVKLLVRGQESQGACTVQGTVNKAVLSVYRRRETDLTSSHRGIANSATPSVYRC